MHPPSTNEIPWSGVPSFCKKNALVPSERKKECKHELGFRYAGKVPCTGVHVCPMCGAKKD